MKEKFADNILMAIFVADIRKVFFHVYLLSSFYIRGCGFGESCSLSFLPLPVVTIEIFSKFVDTFILQAEGIVVVAEARRAYIV